jgi:shikimate kinase
MLCVLIGMPGAGKTTVGRQLARRLGVAFADTDAVIEARLGVSIREYFQREGEAAFRVLESQVLADVMQNHPGVISTGGGIVTQANNRDLLKACGRCVYLRAKPEELMRRLRHDKVRPLLQVADPLAKLQELFNARDAWYRASASIILETGRPSMNFLVREIANRLDLPWPAPQYVSPPLERPY